IQLQSFARENIMSIADTVRDIAIKARQASIYMAKLSSGAKDSLLHAMAAALVDSTDELVAENAKDLAAGAEKGLSAAMLDRLMLDRKRIKEMADALVEVAALPDPVGGDFNKGIGHLFD